MSRTTILIAAVAGLSACCGPKSTTDTASTAAATSRFGGSGADSLFFSLERTPCFGKCATYTVHVYHSGHAVLVGKQNIERIGTHRAVVPAELMQQLLADAEAQGFWGLPAEYNNPQVTDLPSTIIRVVSGDRDHKIRARYQVPEGFKAFLQRCEERLMALPWEAAEGGQ